MVVDTRIYLEILRDVFAQSNANGAGVWRIYVPHPPTSVRGGRLPTSRKSSGTVLMVDTFGAVDYRDRERNQEKRIAGPKAGVEPGRS